MEEIKAGVDEKKKNTGDEKGFSTSLWSFTTSSHPQLRLQFFGRTKIG